jgi:hypothetical protein
VTDRVLNRLKRRIGKERARCLRLYDEYKSTGNTVGLERAFGEANVLSMAMRWIDDEMKKLGPFEKMKKVPKEKK